jgi:aminopeptidase N
MMSISFVRGSSYGPRRWMPVLAIVIAGLLLGAPDAPARGRCQAGAAGIGDAYFPSAGNGGYDVDRYDLDIAYDPATDRLEGSASIRASATHGLCTFDLDLKGLAVNSVEVDGKRVRWSRSGQELVVAPQRPVRAGRRFEVLVRYGGVPVEFTMPGSSVRTGFMATLDGATVAGEPDVAASWFPVNDHPLDKAAYSFAITVPDGYEVVANGLPRGRQDRGSRTTFRWEARDPMAPYLATIDIGQWDVHEWRTPSGVPVYDAVDSAITGEWRATVEAGLAQQGEMLDMLSDAFGPYPFDTVGAIVEGQDDLGFALEDQTRPVYPKFALAGRASVVVHELAHQWFGDDVALARWQDIWLNEGFATYAEWLWIEHQEGFPAREIAKGMYDLFPADDPFWSLPIADPGADRLFDRPIYVRGAMTLQALRNEVGDDAFWAIVRTWAASRSGGNGTTPEFIALAERLSGLQLDDLFARWLMTPTKPGFLAASATPGAHQAARAWLDDRQAERLR